MFTTYPSSGESLWNQLIYSYELSSASDVELTLTNSVGGSDSYIKKLYNIDEVSVNAAPLFRYSSMPTPSVRSSNVYAATDGYAAVVATCEGESTTKSIFTLSKQTVDYGNLMTSMPLDRIIAEGESDIIRIFTSPNEPVYVEVYAVDSSAELEPELVAQYRMIDSHEGVLELVFECPEVEREQLEMYIYHSQTYNTLNYTITKPYQIGESIRLAWLSSAGSIEHHTFPIVKSKSLNRDGAYTYTLLSAYAPESYIMAIAEIVSSAMVWIVEDDEYRRIEVESDIAPIRDEGSLCYLELKVIDNG